MRFILALSCEGILRQFYNYVNRALDDDNSGYISFEEWAMADKLITRATPADKLGWAFRV